MNSSSNNKYLLAGESGGSKTAFCLLKVSGEIVLATVGNGVATVREGILPVKATLVAEIANIWKKARIAKSDISHCYFSLGGPNQREVEAALKKVLPKTEIRVGREGDGDLITTCMRYFGCVATVMAGTGTVAVGEFGGKRYFAGGWGPEFDDAGGGGRIGKDAVAAFLLALDQRGEKTSLRGLFKPLMPKVDIKTFAGRMELKRNIHMLSRKHLADYAPWVYKHFKKGDHAAKEIITRSAKDIAALAAAVLPEKSRLNRIKILCLGGIFQLGREFRDLCAKYLRDLRPECELVFPDNFDLSRGACLMVLKMAGVVVDDKVIQAVLKK
ncbi:MAG: hypothetical protein L6455_03050 [Kiritimatiellae bacterium]|nr:hypothetical protein [Verrucomicrobiota bacterium]MCG2678934.1 hypothetical protein [Kiritimatiellia bacterium]